MLQIKATPPTEHPDRFLLEARPLALARELRANLYRAALVSPNWSYKCEALGFKHGRPHSLQVHWTLTLYNYYFLYIPSYHCGITIGIIICNSISCMLSIRPKLWFTKEVCNRHCVTGTVTQPSCLGSMTVLVFSFLSHILSRQ